MFLALAPRLVLALTLGQEDSAPPPVAPAGDPVAELRECDAVLAEKKVELARTCYEALRLKHPGTPQAHDAERAVTLITVVGAPPAPEAVPAGARPDPRTGGKGGFYVVEPYSPRTQERLRLTTWEKLDFGTTAFIYGLSTGASFAAATDAESPLGPMVVGSLAYTGLAVLYINTAKVDRGDLPLALAITSYLPVTAGLITLTTQTESPQAAGSMIAGAGLLSLPLAFWAAASTDLDPGDTQLVRDCGFWGAVWGVTATAASEYPTDRQIGIAGLVGLYGGLGMGLLLARTSDVSLERVRVSTWGGYGGGIVGGLALAGGNDGQGIFAGIAAGSLLGAVITFVATSGIDEIPEDAQFTDPKTTSLRYLEPALLPVVDREGRIRPRPGVNLLRGRF